jgi:gamma-glutamylcyclotransferase (GGCT)/AIG2-like uncharacterized protein YtfP
MKTSLFVYGTLMFPEVLERLTGKGFPLRPATLFNYQRYEIKDRLYPAIAPMPGHTVEGFLLEELDEASARLLDAFEAPEYKKTELSVSCQGKSHKTHAYVWGDAHRSLLFGEWLPEDFKKQSLKLYLNGIS